MAYLTHIYSFNLIFLVLHSLCPLMASKRWLAVGFACSARFFGQNCSKTPNMGWVVDGRGWEGPEVPGMEVRFFPMAARSTVRGSQLEGD